MYRETKSADNGSTSLERRRRIADDESTSSPYQSPTSLSSSAASDADKRSPATTWHTPRGSPGPPADVPRDQRGHVDRHSGPDDRGPAAAAASSDGRDEVDEPSRRVGVARELTSSDVTATATKQAPDTPSPRDVEHGK